MNPQNNFLKELFPKKLEIMLHLIKATGKNADKKHMPGELNSP
jgi:hypothetical protein